MEGASLAAKRKHEADMFRAYNEAAFNGAAFNGELSKMRKYLPKGAPRRQQSPSEMVAVLRELQARGKNNMKITRVN